MDTTQSTAPTRQLGQAFASTRAMLAMVGRDHLDMRTPCASWDVHDLINHFIGSARWASAAIGSGEGEPDADFAAGDFLAAYDENVARALAAFAADGALDRTVTLAFGEFTGAGLMGIAATDQFVHGWDLARALGCHTDLDPELAEELLVRARTAIPAEFRGPVRRSWAGCQVRLRTELVISRRCRSLEVGARCCRASHRTVVVRAVSFNSRCWMP